MPARELGRLERLVLGVLLPNLVLVGGMLAIANADSRASAAEFGALAVFFMLLATLPITVTVDLLLLMRRPPTAGACFFTGMVPPALVLVAGLVYQSGLWDRLF